MNNENVTVPIMGALKERIVQLYNGHYALIDNTNELTKGEHSGSFAMTYDCVTLLNDDICLTTDDYIIDNRGRRCLRSDADDHDIIYSSHENDYYHREDVVFGYVSRRTEDYFETGNEEVYVDDIFYVNSSVAEMHNIFWDDHYHEYRHEDDMWVEEDEDEQENGNASYHSQTRKNFITKKGWSVGFEVEKEDGELVCEDAGEVRDTTGWCKEKDASLCDSIGFELVSPKLSLYDDKTILNNFENVKRFLNAEKSASCGGHIHIGHDEYSPDEIFEGLSGYFPLFYALYHKRLNVDYCRGKKKSEMAHRKEKYSAIYIREDLGTIEFRIISGVVSMKNLIWRWELMKLVCKGFCKSEVQVCKDMVNKNSKLHQHLLKVYSHKEILDKVNLFIKYSRQYNDKVITSIKPFNVTEESSVEV